jgi:hypothetical protein
MVLEEKDKHLLTIIDDIVQNIIEYSGPTKVNKATVLWNLVYSNKYHYPYEDFKILIQLIDKRFSND